jgi:hypothetical protein
MSDKLPQSFSLMNLYCKSNREVENKVKLEKLKFIHTYLTRINFMKEDLANEFIVYERICNQSD